MKPTPNTNQVPRIDIRRPRLEQPSKTVSYQELAEAMPKLLALYPYLQFTDGYCFGQLEYITIEDPGIDTSMSGGDSNYHYRELALTDQVIITPHGFRINDKVQFIFVTPCQSAAFKNLGELADFQARNRYFMLADDTIKEVKQKNGSGDLARYFIRAFDRVYLANFIGFEAIEGEVKNPSMPTHPVTIKKDGTIKISGLPDSYGYGERTSRS